MQAIRKRDVYSVFLASGLHSSIWPHSPAWPNDTCAVAKLTVQTEKKLFIAWNENRNHAEYNIIQEIDEFFNKLQPIPKDCSLKIFINYSPCSICCDKLMDFLHNYREQNLKMEIVFSCFYYIRRPRCDSGRCPSWFDHKICDKQESYINMRGMKGLLQHDINIRPFRPLDWIELASLLVKYGLQRDGTADDRPTLDESELKKLVEHYGLFNWKLPGSAEDLKVLKYALASHALVMRAAEDQTMNAEFEEMFGEDLVNKRKREASGTNEETSPEKKAKKETESPGSSSHNQPP